MPSPLLSDILHSFGWDQRFELLEKIGAGAMGQVWRAREIGTHRIVALKFLDPSRSGDEQSLARLEIEGQTLMRLREAGGHDHVVPILDFQVTQEHACLVTEFIPGLNLRKWCSSHRLGLRERVGLIAHVARASGWFHGLGIVHRDLKPANILVSAVTHQPVIVDFSIAKVEDNLTLTLTNEALGTAPYMAPEQFDRRRAPVSPATDVYALGATLYELLTQVPPHPGEFTVIIQRHAEEIRPAPPSALNPDIPRDLECIILKALSHRPADRYVDGTALAEDLERFLAGESVKARPLPFATRLVRRARRKPALTAALAACVALGGFSLWNIQHQAAQRQRFALESRLIATMQQSTWDTAALEQAESSLSSLGGHEPHLAMQLRQRFHEDVVHDMESCLQQSHLRDEDFAWLRDMTSWLNPRLPEDAARLQPLITERAGRWQIQAELAAPFTDLKGLFPRSHVQVMDGLLYPIHTGTAANSPPILITDAASVPMEIGCTFVADGEGFHHLALDFAHQNAYLVLFLYKVRLTPAPILSHMGLESADPHSYVLYFKLNDAFHGGIPIPDVRLLDQPFRLTLRVERDWAEASLNNRWHLRLDAPFALGALRSENYCRISWPVDIGLQHLAWRTRHADSSSPLERADLLAAQGQWAAARRLYEDLLGDPHYGREASCKIALCFWMAGEHDAAVGRWEKDAEGPPSLWQERSMHMLALHHLLRKDWPATLSYTDRLPERISSSSLGWIDARLRQRLEDVLVEAGLSVLWSQHDPARPAALARFFQTLQTPPLVLANRLALPFHFARRDEDASMLYHQALTAPDSFKDDPNSVMAATNCLDQWCRLSASEKDGRLAAVLSRWRNSLNGQAIWHMEQARMSARSGNLRQAILSIREARQTTPEKLDNRLHTSLWLLEGMLYRLQKTEDRAQSAWLKAEQVASTVSMKHPLHLLDCMLLHSLTQTWDRATVVNVLSVLASRHLDKRDRSMAQMAFEQVFFSDPAWLTTFNAVLQNEEGRKFAEDYALCRQPPRELVLRFYRLLFEHYFLTTAFPQATPQQHTRVRQIVDALVTEMAMNPRGEISHLYAYLRAWNDPKAAKVLFDTTYPYSPALVEDMKWLLQQRFE
jgi:serine/threonine protein kinase/tetratricopeptide (TPR) repeat protein